MLDTGKNGSTLSSDNLYPLLLIPFGHYSVCKFSPNVVRYCERAGLSACLCVCLSQMTKHGRTNQNRRTLRLNNKATHLTWNSPRTTASKELRPAVKRGVLSVHMYYVREGRA